MEKIDVKETLKSIKENAVKSFIEDKLSSENFSEEQKGLIKGWLHQAVDAGFEIGKKEGFADSNPEVMDKIGEIMTKAFGGDTDTDKLKNFILMQRYISRNQTSIISFYDSIVDKLLNESNYMPRGSAFTALSAG